MVVQEDKLDGAETGSEEEEYYSAENNDTDISENVPVGDG